MGMMAASSRSSSTIFISWKEPSSKASRRISGWSLENSWKITGKRKEPIIGGMPILTWFFRSPRSRIRLTTLSDRLNRSVAMARKISPSRVMRSLRLIRWNRPTPNSSSRSRMALETEGWEIWRASAAREILQLWPHTLVKY